MIKNYPTVLDDNELLFEVLKPAGFTTIGESSSTSTSAIASATRTRATT